jgi:D-arabinose 1-dehydrogenase-like Zn-dependent alcohol dehydrogenase
MHKARGPLFFVAGSLFFNPLLQIQRFHRRARVAVIGIGGLGAHCIAISECPGVAG